MTKRKDMVNGRSPEFTQNKKEYTEKGFSERQAARILEGKQQDNAQIKKRKPVNFAAKQKTLRAARVEPTKKEKILAAHEKNVQMLLELVKMLGEVTKGSIEQEEMLIAQIRAKQKLQEELLHALILEQKGELAENVLSKEVWDLVK